MAVVTEAPASKVLRKTVCRDVASASKLVGGVEPVRGAIRACVGCWKATDPLAAEFAKGSAGAAGRRGMFRSQFTVLVLSLAGSTVPAWIVGL